MGRTVIVGDVHGCRGELEELLAKVGFVKGADRLVFVGDLVARGPDTHGVLALVRELRATSVRGNHEDKVLGMRASGGDGEHGRIAEALDRAEWRQLDAMPLWLDLPEHNLRVVHAGVVPGIRFDRTPPEAILKVRAADGRGGWTDAKSERPLWGELYTGPPHIVFGHNALSEPQLHKWATGIDTGCVYGRELTALVLDADEPMPRGRVAVRRRLVSVPARRKYHPTKR
ncbi:MAG: metallophosphoesterase [Polyangiaceae bacterium]|nr:metallophosphoesterase [Polyangiaceae bacterium]